MLVFYCVVTVVTECQSESQLNSDRYVDSVTVNGSPIDADSLFNFGNAGRYCGPTDMKPFTINIAYSSPVLLREIDIQGSNQILGPSPLFESYVTSFSLSFSEDDGNFTEYIRDTGSTVCHINNKHVLIDYVYAVRNLLHQMNCDATLHCGLPSLPLVYRSLLIIGI